MREDGTGIRYHAKAFGDVGTVIPPIILSLKALFKLHTACYGQNIADL